MTKPSLDDRIAAVRALILRIEASYLPSNTPWATGDELDAMHAVLATLQQHERAKAALRDIVAGNGVPDSMLESKATFREQFARFLQAKAREALAALDAAETETK